MSANRPKALVPMAHVADVRRSIEFYEHFGFTVRNTVAPERGGEPIWAWLEGDGASLMVALADVPFDHRVQAVLFYLYCDDVEGMHARLRSRGVEVGRITTPVHAPRGEFRVMDPDGWVTMVMHTRE